jgi:iron complex outermembrane receptor protein
MRKFIFICTLLVFHYSIGAQNTITGRITAKDNIPLPGATIYIPDLNKGTIADHEGNFQLTELPNGELKIQFSFVGYINRIETVDLTTSGKELNIELIPTIVEAGEIIISGGYNSTQHGNAVKVDVFKPDPALTKSTPNFSEVLTSVPGVDMISKGSGVSKPVIRGLSMNDILVLNNGVRFENYQYSSHHPLGIDEFGIGNVEIIKGPASLLYGSDAIGGVINFIKEKPASVGTITGDYNLQLFSNTLGVTNNLGIKGASKKFFAGVRAGQKSNSDFLQGGGDYVPNSRFNEVSVKTNAGYTGRYGTSKIFYDYSNEKLGLVEDEAIEEITGRSRKPGIWYQQFTTHLTSFQNKLFPGRSKIDINASYQNTELVHFGEIDVVEIQMRLATLSYETILHLPSKENSEYIIGFQGYNQDNKNLNNRETILLPDAKIVNTSAFGLFQRTFFRKLKLQTGIRYDYKSISTSGVGSSDQLETYRPPVNKYFGSFSGSAGATFNYSEELLFRMNAAAAYRTPNLAELTSNGPHELRYEIGNADLLPENSREFDMSIHYHIENFIFDLAGFFNRVNNYIFISPTTDTTDTGMKIYRYKQSDSYLFGGEAVLHFHPEQLKWLHSKLTFTSVTGKQNNGDYLPFIPAHKLFFEIRAEKEKLLILHDAFVALNILTAFRQDNPAPDETATNSYSLLDLSFGGNIKIRNQVMSLIISANNLFDRKYTDHLSTLKEVNLLNQGRNIALSLKIPFGIFPDTDQ